MKIRTKRLNQAGFDHVMLVVGFVVVFALIGSFLLINSLAAATYVKLHIGSYSGNCVSGGSLASCSTNGQAEIWQTLSGNNFQIKNQTGLCMDDWNRGIQQYPQSETNKPNHTRVPIAMSKCYSGDVNQEWNWSGSELKNVASHGCINALGGNESTNNATLGVYVCNGQNNELFFEKSYSTSNGGGNPGGSNNQAAVCRNLGYASGSYQCNNIGIAFSFMVGDGSGFQNWANYTQEECLGQLWQRESGWNSHIMNAAGENASLNGAYGIAQALGHGGPGVAAKTTVQFLDGKSITGNVNEYPSYVANLGVPLYQIIWGLNYIKTNQNFNNPCSAYNYDAGHGYYEKVGGQHA